MRLKSAVEVALAGEKNRNGNIAVVFSRSCATASSSWRNAFALAKRKMLPLIFVCHSDPQNEPESTSPRAAKKNASRQPSRGFPVFKVDGDDVVAVYRVAHEAIARARKNRGPSLIECAPYGLSVGSKSRRSAIRNEEASGQYKAIDPILNMEDYLAAKGLFTAEMRQRIARGFRKELGAALTSAGLVNSRRDEPASEFRPMKTQ